jgi:membrane protease YdiL (CAAX protease family)
MHSSQLAHAWAPLLILFIVGLVLTLTRVVTGSVVPGFLIHVGYNASIFAVLYLSTDGFRHLDKLLQ